MNVPSLATTAVLARLARPDESMAMRVILRRVANTGPYTVHGKVRKYVFEYHHKIGAHVLDVPLSVWNSGITHGAYRDNPSIAHDIQATRSVHLAPLVIHPIPFGNGAVPAALVIAPTEDASMSASLAAFEVLCRAMDAPSEILEAMQILRMAETEDSMRAQAIQMITNGLGNEENLESYHNDIDPPTTTTIEADIAAEKRRKNAEKVRRHREKKRAQTANEALV
jgi:hypothetical protein